MTEIAVVPKAITKTIHHVAIAIDNFTLNATEGGASVYEYSEDNRVIDVVRVSIPTDIWTTWGQDDNFIIDYVLTELDLTPLS